VTLSEPAPSGGGVVALASDSAYVSVPGSVVVSAGATTATFPVTAASPTTTQTAHVTASYYGIASTPATVTVLPASAVFVSLTGSVTGGTTATGSIGLCTAAAAGGAVVALSSNDAAAIPPASVTVPQGATSVPVSVATSVVTAARTATITASYRGSSGGASVRINPPPARCPSGQQTCSCSDGRHTCTSTAQACFTFCKG
jgi:hypothetical protein